LSIDKREKVIYTDRENCDCLKGRKETSEMGDLVGQIRKKAKKLNRCIVLPESNDGRVVRAANMITKQKIARVILLGNQEEISKKFPNTDLKGITIIDPKKVDIAPYAQLLFDLRKEKGMTQEMAQVLARDPMYFGTLMVKRGEADGMAGGACHSTGDMLRPGMQLIKAAPGISTVSSCFFMMLPKGSKFGEILVFGDCAVIPNPMPQQLADIAIASAESAKKLAGLTPKVALLSFSTKGSAKGSAVDKVTAALEIAKHAAPELCIDGELQADAALVSAIASLKAPQSIVAGKANVLIFPDLQSGNIAYKLVERLAGAKAIGPICQGFAKPLNDLSRGCSVEDIITVVAITAMQVVD